MRPILSRTLVYVTLLLASVLTATAQSKKDPLTEQQIEAVREAGDQPAERLKLYVGYIDERAKSIHTLSVDAHAQSREARLHKLYEEFTQLSDELQDNMDAFDEQHADMRKVLKVIVDKTGEWTTALNEPKPNADYDFPRKSAVDANQSAHETATQMLPQEEKYFAEQKKAAKAAEKAASQSDTR